MNSTETALSIRQRERMRPWATKAVQLVSRKISDTRAHAERAVTETLKATPDGRPSLALIRRNPSFKASLNRLDELWAEIGGPSVTAISGLAHDATEAFYEDARDYWFGEVPDGYRVKSREATKSQLLYVRGLLWFGQPIRQDFAPQFKRLHNTLSAALGAAGSHSDVDQPQITSLRTWESQSRATLIQRLGLALNDANQRADLQAMKDSILPQYHDKP